MFLQNDSEGQIATNFANLANAPHDNKKKEYDSEPIYVNSLNHSIQITIT